MSSLSHSISGHLQLSNWSPYQLSLNLPQLSTTLIDPITATLTAHIKSQLYNKSLHLSLSNLSQLSTASIAFPTSQLPTFFIKAFKHRVINTNEFPLIIDAGHICHSVAHYKRYIKSYITIISRVYYYYRLFVSLLSSVIILRSDLMVMVALDNDVINMVFLNHCGRDINEYWFCYLCFYMLKQKKVSKFFFVNKVNVILCQDYPPTLEALTLVREMLIAQYHPIMSILKI